MSIETPLRIFYFGCWGGTGHFLWTRDALSAERVRHPWGVGRRGLDGALAPGFRDPRRGEVAPEDQHQGAAALVHRDGWTALAFWDRSVDHRAGSNSVFLAPGTLTADEMIKLARETFPSVWARFMFPVTVRP